MSKGKSLQEVTKLHIISVLQECHGNRRAAAKELKMSERTLYRRIRELGIPSKEHLYSITTGVGKEKLLILNHQDLAESAKWALDYLVKAHNFDKLLPKSRVEEIAMNAARITYNKRINKSS